MIINIGWLYPDLMSTYGDRGNIIALSYRIKKRNIKVNIIKISLSDSPKLLKKIDMVFMGGAQDKQQEIVNKDLKKNKKNYLKEAIDQGIPGLYICGAYQFLGNYYKTADETIIEGLGIFDLYTESPKTYSHRLIGDLIVKANFLKTILVGFENHNGRTYLGKKVTPFAQVLKGYGNNGVDKTEGVIYKNSIGTYMHGPILPKNPNLTDWLISKALELKYKRKIDLISLNNQLENKARKVIMKRYSIKT